MRAAIDALHAAFAVDLPEAPLRSQVETAAGGLLLMPAWGEAGVGVKLVTLTDSNPGRGLPFVNALYVLFDAETQVPAATLDGAALTALRTAAVSGVATRLLARKDASRVAIFGAGVQARSHLEAMVAVRPVRDVMIVSRTRDRAEALADVAFGLGLQASIGSPDAVTGFDIVCTCTTSQTPLFDGALLRAGAHVNAIGAYLATMRELDTEAVRRSKVVVDTREAAFAEAGDLVIPLGEGAIGREHVLADLAELVRGAEVRTSTDDVTVFKAVGVAFEDLIVARAAVDRL
ncbi:MAG TPA: ornithine cyclodeaminase family protein [Actinomycetota bacterium]|nr:ornithine cyclodeaminase family protein [Actinomycetota bacterium]